MTTVEVFGERRTLDHRPSFDKRSRRFGVRAEVGPEKTPRSFTYGCTLCLNQGAEGACVGHAFAHDAAARPVVRAVRSVDAFGLYRYAQSIDGFPDGEEGTSVIAGAKAYVHGGFATGYRWAFGLADTILGLGYAGPAVLGIGWRTAMFTPAADGFVNVAGVVEGGHAILARQLHLVWGTKTTPEQKREADWLERVDLARSWVRLHNSWGGTWGQSGTCLVSLEGLQKLIEDDGEVCFPVGRQ